MTKRRLSTISPTLLSRHEHFTSETCIYVAPASAHPSFAEAVLLGGGKVVASAKDATGLVWADGADSEGLRTFLEQHPHIRWVQLPRSGVEAFAEAGLFDLDHMWTSAKGVCALSVAEHALALALAGVHTLQKGRSRRQRDASLSSGRTSRLPHIRLWGTG